MQAVLYSKDNCQWCERAKMLLESVEIPYLEYKYGKDFTRNQFYAEFGEGATFPQVNINEEYVGGFKETLNYLKDRQVI